jgi:hypothetical protein
LKLPGLPFPLEPAGSPPPQCRVRQGVLTLTGAAGTDLFVDPAGLVRVGFLAQSPRGEGCAATFDHITFRPGATANLRDGS